MDGVVNTLSALGRMIGRGVRRKPAVSQKDGGFTYKINVDLELIACLREIDGRDPWAQYTPLSADQNGSQGHRGCPRLWAGDTWSDQVSPAHSTNTPSNTPDTLFDEPSLITSPTQPFLNPVRRSLHNLVQ